MEQIPTTSDSQRKMLDEGVFILKDSGERMVFPSGAVRDIQEGKGRCDLLPLDIVGRIVGGSELKNIEKFKKDKDVEHLFAAILDFSDRTGMDICTLMLEASKQFESGAIKYGDNNWKLGMDLHCYISSGSRHLLQYIRGDVDEPHDRAFVWNMICAIWTITYLPDFDDIK